MRFAMTRGRPVWFGIVVAVVSGATALGACGGGNTGGAGSSPDGSAPGLDAGPLVDATIADGGGDAATHPDSTTPPDAAKPHDGSAPQDGATADVIADAADASDAADTSPPFTITPGDASVVSTHAQRVGLGFLYGYSDGDFGAITQDAGYTFFVSGHTQPDAGLCPGTPGTQGVYRIGTDPSSITTNYGCTALVVDSPGSADGGLLGAFDRDYVGGGPVMRLPNPDGGAPAIVLVYHAEFHWGPLCGTENAPCFYGTLGMASSLDDGATFVKLGEIIQPSVSRPDWVARNPNASLPDGTGPFIVGDANHQPIDPDTADPATSFLYVFYIDQNYADAGATCPSGGRQCLATARASMSTVIAAAFAQDPTSGPTLFHKWYAGDFTQPGVSGDPNDALPSGAFTPVAGATYEESVLYDRTINQAILAYRTPIGSIEIQTTSDLVNWPGTPIASVSEEVDGGLRYPSLIGETTNANAGATQPWLFYTAGDVWRYSTFENRRLVITPTP
jgi:hypothetical protein